MPLPITTSVLSINPASFNLPNKCAKSLDVTAHTENTPNTVNGGTVTE